MLISRLAEFFEIPLVCTVVGGMMPTHQVADGRVITHDVQMIKAARSTPYTREQPINQLDGGIATVGTLLGKRHHRQLILEVAIVKHFV
jgi:hypothetical protein